MRRFVLAACVLLAILVRAAVGAEGDDLLFDALEHPAIGYATTPLHDPIAELSRRIQAGATRLPFEPTSGYLRPLLEALRIPVESQMAVFSKTSLQSSLIAPANPRAIFFTDDVAVAWPRGGFIEIAAHDPQQGVQFYVLEQRDSPAPSFLRAESIRPGMCLTCHHAFATQGVPGLLARSVAAAGDGRILPQLANYITDDRSPLDERWAGWFVTGRTGSARHLGNPDAVAGGEPQISAHATTLESLPSSIDRHAYPSDHSDIAALLVFDHQARMINLLTRVGWEVRIATADHRAADRIVQQTARELVDALLFVDEAPLPPGIAPGPAFREAFAARGPSDHKGRSLREIDLHGRLMRYPCSYMIYTAAFDALPAPARAAVYRRLWEVLSGADRDRRYARLSADDRRAIIDILRDTKPDLPPYFT
jgi:hypothetical protein